MLQNLFPSGVNQLIKLAKLVFFKSKTYQMSLKHCSVPKGSVLEMSLK
jgi:hypothetical protein